MTLALDELVVGVGSRTLLPRTSLDVLPGEILGVVGPSGSGKTTTLLAVAGLSRPSSGRVALDDVETWTADRRDIGMVSQPVLLAGSLTVAENISLTMQARASRDADEETAYSPDACRRRVAELMELLSLTGVADREPSRLSGGQRQRVAVARAVAARPAVVVADEPTSELDHDSRELVVRLLEQTARDGSAVVLSTHDTDVAAICHQVVTLGG